MSVQVKYRRDTAAYLASFVGAPGEILVDTDNNTLQIHDGVTPGGWRLAKLSDVVDKFGNQSLGAGRALSGVRVALTSSGYTVPMNCGLVRFTQTGVVASATVTLPSGLGTAQNTTALPDGYEIQFVNYNADVSAFSFSPSVNGWANGSILQGGAPCRIRWDSVAGSWYREQ